MNEGAWRSYKSDLKSCPGQVDPSHLLVPQLQASLTIASCTICTPACSHPVERN